MATYQLRHHQKIVLIIQDSANAVSANTFLSRVKCLECLPSPFMYSCQTCCKTRDSFINYTCGKLSHIFSIATFNSESVFGFGWSFPNKLCASLPRHDISISFKFGELLGGHCSFPIICGQFSRGIVEKHVQCAQSPMHLVESTAPSGSSRLHSSMNFGSRN